MQISIWVALLIFASSAPSWACPPSITYGRIEGLPDCVEVHPPCTVDCPTDDRGQPYDFVADYIQLRNRCDMQFELEVQKCPRCGPDLPTIEVGQSAGFTIDGSREDLPWDSEFTWTLGAESGELGIQLFPEIHHCDVGNSDHACSTANGGNDLWLLVLACFFRRRR